MCGQDDDPTQHDGGIGYFRPDPNVPGTCPRCRLPLPLGYPGALSRADNKTEVCPDCGRAEAIHDHLGSGLGSQAVPARDWPTRD